MGGGGGGGGLPGLVGIGNGKALLASGGMQRNITQSISPVACPQNALQANIIHNKERKALRAQLDIPVAGAHATTYNTNLLP